MSAAATSEIHLTDRFEDIEIMQLETKSLGTLELMDGGTKKPIQRMETTIYRQSTLFQRRI